ncbi:hypothetical protein M413DRAFT_413516 [Hebeloma cylindrosporum]|uniref:Pkinase-domain-containing protein n=1 Tax=Hebeloma cylindrosporum TaxID=76867 RepID=A0A0C3C7I6_HEBCY|nr:hypothetical protein M413DRAFT_413516 [Hebeloma cylindrosporum h7]
MQYEEDAHDDSQDSEQQTQTQSTQEASQPDPISLDAHLWGYLQPCSAALTRIDFWKIHPRYTIGRNTEINQVVLPGPKVSNQHCVITWDGKDSRSSTVVVLDLSSNGTFINGEKIGKNQTRILNEGNEIAFGTFVPQSHNGGLEDYRFVYRHMAAGLPEGGLYAKYDVGNDLGKGSFATVRRAVHRETGKWFAVKMIEPSKATKHGRSTKTSTFAREISIMEKLEHPNICKFVEVFVQDDNSINLVLELIEGGDLLEHILKSGGLCEVDACDITYQICDALAYIHSKGITHRDLKPENVLLTTHKPPIVKVADFGLAKVVDSLTMLRTMCGTPSYLAPEVVKQENREGYDNLVDSWSVGVIVFSMLTNSGPFIEDENEEVRTRIIKRTIDWKTLENKAVSQDAFRFVRQLLVEDPLRRLSLTNALRHPWLRDHVPFHKLDNDELGDASMTAYGKEFVDETNLHTGEGPLAAAPRNGMLQRQSDIIHRAAEEGKALPEPSWEMIAYATARDDNLSNEKGPNKRMRAALTPLPEEVLDDADMNSSAVEIPGLSAGKVKKAESPDESSASGPRRSGRRSKVPRRS